jgi:hypothetical protein
MANGILPSDVMQSGQYYTRFTEAAEQAVTHITGIDTNINLTQAEYNIEPYVSTAPSPHFAESINQLNANILNLTSSYAQFKTELLNNQASCRIFTFLYTADLKHVLEEAQRFVHILTELQNRNEQFNQNFREFWDHNMSDHAKSMRGLFDPTETGYFTEANRYAKTFDALAADPNSTDTLSAVRGIGDFKAETAHGLLSCKVKAIMSPLYADHNLREALHYRYLLETT